MIDQDEARALLRIRVLRRDAYRCMFRHAPQDAICGALAKAIGEDTHTGEFVTLCPSHASR